MLTTGFNEVEWLNNYFDGFNQQVNGEEIKSVLYFALIWSMFESLTCKRTASVTNIEGAVRKVYDKKLLQFDDFNPLIGYFRNRYLIEGHTNEKFERLNWHRRCGKDVVESVLKGDSDDIYSVVLALLLIVRRLRNNLFHGEKNVYELNYQVDNFEVANQVLATFLDLHKRV